MVQTFQEKRFINEISSEMRGVSAVTHIQKILHCVKLQLRCKTGFEMIPLFGWLEQMNNAVI